MLRREETLYSAGIKRYCCFSVSTAYEVGQDGRTAKIPRTESRDSDRRSPLHSNYRIPSSASNDSHMDSHPSGSESRIESRDSKENREVRVESREPRAESREFHGEAAKKEYQSGKGEKEVRFESRGEDGKELKYDRENSSDPKGDMKVEKDGYGGSSGHLGWKESREYHRGKRHPEAPGGGVDPWQMPCDNTQVQIETVKEGFATEERGHVETHEAVGENKFDPKGEDRFKDKESNGSGEGKESAREERETERWEREPKDLKDKGRLKEKEKDHVKREPLNGIEKDGSHNEKELGDGSVRTPEQENTTSEQRKQKELDNWKNVDGEAKEKRRGRDVDTEGDRSEKCSRGYEKESDDGSAGAEGANESDRDAFNYGVQQRKRMLRPRGSPQVGNREARFRPHSQENER
ncbi:hypothetical protein SLEP1_g38104 [Rubroshorea leprosula]|uniref:Uncharacterized protein n=1 Tax=Rubroshorea leprosula TaxID=152421 RepID=A0AAV5KX41_9ROSI|nr:hypothetical protein SLEP1_g38104 [Rubroshorea leprosula]